MRDVYLKDDVEQDRTVWEKETEVYIAIAGKGVRNMIIFTRISNNKMLVVSMAATVNR